MTAIADILAGVPREKVLPGPSPVHRLPHLEQALGGSLELYMKRDDVIRPLCGNKLRYIEFILAAAKAEGADTILHCGGATSNYMAQLAIIGVERGYAVCIAIQGEAITATWPNPLLIALHGGRLRFVGNADCGAAKQAWAEELRATGRKVYVVGPPFGNQSAILGFLSAASELSDQIAAGFCPPVDDVYMCSAGNSYLGLRLGAALLNDSFRVRAFSPIRFADTGLTNLAGTRNDFLRRKLAEFVAFLGRPLPTFDPDVDEAMVGAGYAVPSENGLAAMRQVARLEGIAMDPVYTGKAMAGLFADVASGRLAPGRRVLFWHSGGTANLFHFPELATQ